MNTWLYHINPKSSEGYTYEWDLERPQTLLGSSDREWSARNMFRQVNVGDVLCVYMKNIQSKQDAVYVIGTISHVNVDKRTFIWRPDQKRSARTLAVPISKEVVRSFFGRGYGPSMQRLTPSKQESWLQLLGSGEVIDGVPLIKADGVPPAQSDSVDPIVSAEHGKLGELHVFKILSKRYPPARGFEVVHVSKQDPSADHDIAVKKDSQVVRFVEVKTRVGVPGTPVVISDRQIARRNENRRAHSIFIVYLGTGGLIRCVLEIGAQDSFALKPRHFWLTPGIP